MPRAGRNWDRRLLAADVISETVPSLVNLVRQGGEPLHAAEDPQGEPYTDYYDYYRFGGVLVPDAVREAAGGSDTGELSMHLIGPLDWLVSSQRPADEMRRPGALVVAQLRTAEGELTDAPEQLLTRAVDLQLQGAWLRVDPPPRPDAEPEAILRHLEGTNPGAPRLAFNRVRGAEHLEAAALGVVFEEEARRDEYADAWIFLVAVRDKRPRTKGRVTQASGPPNFLLLRGLRCSPEALGERIPETAALRSKTATVVGLGSLGAPLALGLARNLIGGLNLVDPDFVDPAASVRWELGVGMAGASKVVALIEALAANYPFTAVQGDAIMVGAAARGEDHGDRFLYDERLAQSDLVIEATAEEDVTAAIADMAWRLDKPFITVWSVEGVGGVVARIVPGETGCFNCLELYLSPGPGTIAMPDPPADERRVQPKGCADPTFTAAAQDLLPLVDHAGRVALAELSRGSTNGYPRYDGDIHVLFLREADRSLREPLHWSSHALTIHSDCIRCNS